MNTMLCAAKADADDSPKANATAPSIAFRLIAAGRLRAVAFVFFVFKSLSIGQIHEYQVRYSEPGHAYYVPV
jgi:hypothetical protein